MTEAAIHLEVRSPLRFDRIQLLLRIALAIALGWVGITAGWLACLLYVTLPVIAALAISSGGGERFQRDFAPRLWRVLRWLVQFNAYMMLLVDRFPTGDDDAVHVDVCCTARPSPGSALARLVTTIPSALVLAVLGCVSGFLWLVGALLILLGGPLPVAARIPARRAPLDGPGARVSCRAGRRLPAVLVRHRPRRWARRAARDLERVMTRVLVAFGSRGLGRSR